LGENLKHIEVIPLFEEVNTMMNSDEIIKKYLTLHKKRFGKSPSYLRPYLARSDPALNSGLVPTVLAIKVALSRYRMLQEKSGIYLYPIIGTGSLPFRGGLNPDSIDKFVGEYGGIRTALLQSAFRYDYPKTKVKRAIKDLEAKLAKTEIAAINKAEEKRLKAVIKIFEKEYRITVENLAPLINDVSLLLPRRRERVQHIGLFGYSRGVGKVRLPRAITFTGALYSLGIPPEIIGTGRALMKAQKEGLFDVVEKYYLNLRSDLNFALNFVNEENTIYLEKKFSSFGSVRKDLQEVKRFLGKDIHPISEGKEYAKLTTRILSKFLKKEDLSYEINRAAILRKSLG
jgi:phosphoenolpyruvate carboxylase